MTMSIPARDDERWQSEPWRTEQLLKLMHDFGLKVADVGAITGHTDRTVYCWRTVKVRPISVNDLKVLMFELARAYEQA